MCHQCLPTTIFSHGQYTLIYMHTAAQKFEETQDRNTSASDQVRTRWHNVDRGLEQPNDNNNDRPTRQDSTEQYHRGGG